MENKKTKNNIDKNERKLPLIPTRDVIVLEGLSNFIEIGRPSSILAIDSAIKNCENKLILIPQKNANQKQINKIEDLHKTGILVEIEDFQKISDTHIRLRVKGQRKIELLSLEKSIDNKSTSNLFFWISTVKINSEIKVLENDSNKKNVDEVHKLLFETLPDNLKQIFIKNELPLFQKKDLYSIENLNKIVSSFGMPFAYLYTFFNYKTFNSKISNIKNFLEQVIKDGKTLLEENHDVDREIDNEVRKSLDTQNKEFILREKLKVIRSKLGEDVEAEDKIESILNNQELKNMIPEDIKLLIKKEKAKLKTMMSSSPDANITRNYIDLLGSLPWRKTSIEEIEIKRVKKILEEQHYGLKDVKERIIEFVAVMINNQKKHPDKYKKVKIADSPNTEINENLFVKENGMNKSMMENSSPVITLLGPPGVGKTSVAKSLADALNRKFVKISLGGVSDEAEIRGHRKTYVGAMPGKIISAIKKAGVSNPVILLDEIDKLASSHKGDPASALLEVLDPEQNANFQDHFLEVEYDLSKVLFIATANYYEDIPTPLIDRVELIELSSYTLLEKINIAKKYLIDRVVKQNGLEKEQFQINDNEIEYIIRHYTLEAGVRNLQRTLDKIARKIALGIIEGKIKEEFTIDIPTITKFLGVIKFNDDDKDEKPRVGVVNGLAYTSYGGSTLPIEVTTFPGKGGDIKITGQLKDVMQESAQIALGYVRSHAKEFDINFNFEENSIHIHVPEGAVPKDGPSAGVTFTTTLISALSKKPVSHQVGMTGEITLRGKVLPIGGLKEKSLAAMKNGIKTIFIPKENERNIQDIPDEVKKVIKFIPVKHYSEIYDNLFKNTKPIEDKRKK